MADIDKVIKGLEIIIWEVDHNSMWLPGDNDIRDAIELLREQQKQIDSLGTDLTDSCDRVRRLRKELKEKQNQIYEMQDRTEYLEDKVKAQPQIVRCKDCRYWDYRTNGCRHLTGAISPIVKTHADWFCADGERTN